MEYLLGSVCGLALVFILVSVKNMGDTNNNKSDVSKKSLPSSEWIWIQARSMSDRNEFMKWFEQYR